MSTATPGPWHGVPRLDIPWYPTVDAQACIGCELCHITCSRGVYDMRDRKAVAASPYSCMVGCAICALVCPTEAIHLPGRELPFQVEREHMLLKAMQGKAKAKRGGQDAPKARTAAEASLARATWRTHMELAGAFDETRFLALLTRLIADHPVDVTDLQLHVPTLKGLTEKVPAFLSFDVTSTRQEDIHAFLPLLRDLARRNGFSLVNEVNL